MPHEFLNMSYAHIRHCSSWPIVITANQAADGYGKNEKDSDHF